MAVVVGMALVADYVPGNCRVLVGIIFGYRIYGTGQTDGLLACPESAS